MDAKNSSNATIDGSGPIPGVSAVDAHEIAKERLSQLSGVAQEQGKQAAALARQVVTALAARMGKAALGATVMLWIAWFFLPALRISMIFDSRSFTAWQVLGVDLSNFTTLASIKHGLLSFIGLLAISAPFAAPFIKRTWARYLNAMPLAYLALAAVKIRWDIGHLAGMAGRADSLFADGAESFRKAIMDTVSIGLGTYALLIAGVILAACSVRNRTNA